MSWHTPRCGSFVYDYLKLGQFEYTASESDNEHHEFDGNDAFSEGIRGRRE